VRKGTQNEEEKQNEPFESDLEKEKREKLLEKIERREKISYLIRYRMFEDQGYRTVSLVIFRRISHGRGHPQAMNIIIRVRDRVKKPAWAKAKGAAKRFRAQ
jgi:hypothetical protein